MEAGHFKLGGLVALVDVNGLQIDGRVCEVMEVQPPTDKYRSFGWDAIECDGHDLGQLVDAMEPRGRRGPAGGGAGPHRERQGVSFMENQAGWHGKAPNADELTAALFELGLDGWWSARR